MRGSLTILLILGMLVLPTVPVTAQNLVITTSEQSQYLWRANPQQFNVIDASIFPHISLNPDSSLSGIGRATLAWKIQVDDGLIGAFATYNRGVLQEVNTFSNIYQSLDWFGLEDDLIVVGVRENTTDFFVVAGNGDVLTQEIDAPTSDHQLFISSSELFLYAYNDLEEQGYYHTVSGITLLNTPTSERVVAAGYNGAVIEQEDGERVWYTATSSNQSLDMELSDQLEIGHRELEPVIFDLGQNQVVLPSLNTSVSMPGNTQEFAFFGLQSSLAMGTTGIYELDSNLQWDQVASFSFLPFDFSIIDFGLYLGPVEKSGLGLAIAGMDNDNDGMADVMEDYKGSDTTEIDSDDDGISDSAEILYGTNPVVADAHDDTDGDGLSNLEEIRSNLDPRNPDSDYGRALDGWEREYGFDPLDPSDDELDPDGDNALNWQESLWGSNPENSDTDGDGMPDGWEIRFTLDPTVANADEDPDEDGFTNIQEYRRGTDPLVRNTEEIFHNLEIEILLILLVSLPMAIVIWRRLLPQLKIDILS